MHGTRSIQFAACVAAAAAALLCAPGARAQKCGDEDRVLWVGDSWAEIQWGTRALGDVFNQFGYGDKHEYNDDPTGGIDPNQTAISGMTAQVAADPGGANYPLRIANVLNAKPSIDIVLVSLGGNDMIGGGWMVQGPAYNPAVSNVAIVNNIATVVDASLAVRPDVNVVIYGYDYVGLWEYVLRNIGNVLGDPIVFQWVVNFGNPPAGDFYDDLLDLETRKKAYANAHPSGRVFYVNNLGTMQSLHGHDTANVGAGVTAYPDGSNFPVAPITIPGQGRVGTDRFGEPVGVQIWRSDVDWIHLSDAAYRQLCINNTTQYFFSKFRGTPNATFISAAADDGFVRGNGTFDSGQLRMGTESSLTCRSILSFNTSGIPAGSTVTRASVFFMRTGATGTNPFGGTSQGEPRIDVRTGFFGASSALEAGDWNAAATATDVGCYAGTVPSNNYYERVDLEPAGLAAIATGAGAVTQLRAYFQITSGTNNHVTFADGTLANTFKPFLDVFFTTPTPTPSATPSATASMTPSATPSPTPSATSSLTASNTPIVTPSLSPSPTASITPSPTPSATASLTASATASETPSPTASDSPSPSATASNTASSTASPTPSPTASDTPTPTLTPSATPSASATPSPTPTSAASASPSPTPNAGLDWSLYE